jgi:hypothetical protein
MLPPPAMAGRPLPFRSPAEVRVASRPSTDPTPMSPRALLACQYGAWYARFARFAPASVLLPVPEAFEDFLLEDGVVLGDDTDAVGGLGASWRGPPHRRNAATLAAGRQRGMWVPAPLQGCLQARCGAAALGGGGWGAFL